MGAERPGSIPDTINSPNPELETDQHTQPNQTTSQLNTYGFPLMLPRNLLGLCHRRELGGIMVSIPRLVKLLSPPWGKGAGLPRESIMATLGRIRPADAVSQYASAYAEPN